METIDKAENSVSPRTIEIFRTIRSLVQEAQEKNYKSVSELAEAIDLLQDVP